MSDMAWYGRKPCGCGVFARLAAKGVRGSGQFPKGLDIKRVPLARANVTVCRCD